MGRHAESAVLDMLGKVEGLGSEEAERLVRALEREVARRIAVSLGEACVTHCTEDAPKAYRLGWAHAEIALEEATNGW